jgi:hypothetical protein
MTVDEYVTKFESLARFSNNLQNQLDEAWKSKKFKQGLRHEVRNLVITQRIREYQTLIQACQLPEQSFAAMAVNRQLLWKRKREEGSSKGGKDKEIDHKSKGTILK